MKHFQTQSHQRNHDGNVVVTMPQRRPKRRFRGIFMLSAITITALMVGSWLGTTALHNHQTLAPQSEPELNQTIAETTPETTPEDQPIMAPDQDEPVITKTRRTRRHRQNPQDYISTEEHHPVTLPLLYPDF